VDAGNRPFKPSTVSRRFSVAAGVLPHLRPGRRPGALTRRDAGAILETALKEAAGSSKYGLRLVDIFVEKLENDQRYTNTSVKRFRTDLRTVFKFIRNEFAHWIADVLAIEHSLCWCDSRR
jgi:hypothetical protein